MAFDQNQFKSLHKKTHDLIKNKKNDNDLIIIESNINALKLLSYDIEDEEKRKDILSSLDQMMAGSIESFELDILDKENEDENIVLDEDKTVERLRLETELLETSKVLFRKVDHFSKKVGDDSNVLENVAKKYQDNVYATKKSISDLNSKIDGISPFRIFMIAILMFFIMYFLIRAT